MKNWLFGYASLMDPVSAARTLGASPRMIPVVLSGFGRDFGLSIRFPDHYRCAHCKGRVYGVAAADCQPDSSSCLAGFALPVSLSQLEACDRREVSYRRVEVSECCEPALPGRVWVYCGLPEFRVPPGVLPLAYWQMIEQAAASHPAGELILSDRPDLPLRDLEFIRYTSLVPEGECACLQ